MKKINGKNYVLHGLFDADVPINRWYRLKPQLDIYDRNVESLKQFYLEEMPDIKKSKTNFRIVKIPVNNGKNVVQAVYVSYDWKLH